MPYSSGVFQRLFAWTQDRNNGVKIQASRMDQEFDGIATALSNCILKDGTQTITADIPLSGHKITSLGAATAGTDALSRDAADARFHRYDAAQTLTSAQKIQAVTNIGLPTDNNVSGFRNLIRNGNFVLGTKGTIFTVGASVAVMDCWIAGSGGFSGGVAGGQPSDDKQASVTSGTLVQIIPARDITSTGPYVLSWVGTAQARVAINGAGLTGAFASSPLAINGTVTVGTSITVEFSTGTLQRVQLEVGSNPTGFERRPAVVERQIAVTTPSAGLLNRIRNGQFQLNNANYTSSSAAGAGVQVHDGWVAGSSGVTYSFTTGTLPDPSVTLISGSIIQIVPANNLEIGRYVLSWTGSATARAGINTAPSGTFVSSPLIITKSNANETIQVEFTAGSVGAVQLEPGQVATAFERRPVELETLICQLGGFPVIAGGAQTLTAAQQAQALTNLGGGTLLKRSVFTSSGTWTKDARTTKVLAMVWGAGGGSGGVAVSSAGTHCCSGAGGAGGYSERYFTGAGATETVTVGAGGTAGASGNNAGGAGGTSSFGTWASASGGGAGSGGLPGSSQINFNPSQGAGGVGTGGDVNITGPTGVPASYANGTSAIFCLGSMGPGAPRGAGAPLALVTTGVGGAGLFPGGGAGGSVSYNGAAAQAGAAGAAGLVMVWEYA